MSSKTNIAFVYAGGTLGMKLDADGKTLIPPLDDGAFREATGGVLQNFQARCNALVTFLPFDTIDSSDRDPKNMKQLLQYLKSIQGKFNGIVVGHGTDTLAPVAGFTSLGFCDPDYHGSTSQQCPIVFTAAQKSLVFQEGDAISNLFHSLQTAYLLAQKSINRTVITFREGVYNATRTMKKHDHDFDAFSSPGAPELGHVSSRGVEIFPHVNNVPFRRNDLTPDISSGVSVITVHPAMDPGDILYQAYPKKKKVTIVKTLGEGNVPDRLIGDIETLVKRHKNMVILTTQFPGGGVGEGVYILGKRALEAGAVSAGNMTTDMAILKALWLYGYGIRDRDKFTKKFQTAYVDELSN